MGGVAVVASLLTGCVVDEAEEAISVQQEHVVANGTPVAVLSVDAGVVSVGQLVEFRGHDSIDPEGGRLVFAWDMGDGTEVIQLASEFTHSYDAPGDYTVTLTVTDAWGAKASTQKLVTVSPADPLEALSISIFGDEEGVTLPERVNSGESVTFTGVAAGGEGELSWDWRLGDDAHIRLSGSEAVHQLSYQFFNKAQTLKVVTVSLDVRDAQGRFASRSVSLEIAPSEQGQTLSEEGQYQGEWRWMLAEGEDEDPSGIGMCAFHASRLRFEHVAGEGLFRGYEMRHQEIMTSYTGQLQGRNFTLKDDAYRVQTIEGVFESDATFTGTYRVNFPGLPECSSPRQVVGFRL